MKRQIKKLSLERELVKELLDKWNICYTAVFAILDYYDAQGEVEYFENGEFKVS